MIPEDLNHTIQFIVESQARLTAAQEQDRQDRVKFEEWSKGLHDRLSAVEARQARLLEWQTQIVGQHSDLLERQSDLLEHQSQRLDRLDQLYEDSRRQEDSWEKRWDNWVQEDGHFKRQVLHLLNMILDRLPPAPSSG